jgi:predicted DNA-binding transcriptional regulator AlpA
MEALMDTLLKETEVYKIVGFKKSKLERMIAAKEFPKPIKFGNRNRWKQSTVTEWINSLEVA